jgi:hypothetical protein
MLISDCIANLGVSTVKWGKQIITVSSVVLLTSCASVSNTIPDADFVCSPAPDDEMVQLVETLSKRSVQPMTSIPDLKLEFTCDTPMCVWRVDDGEEDYKSSRFAMYDKPSNTLITATGLDNEYLVSRIGFKQSCVSMNTAYPLYLSSELNDDDLGVIFKNPDELYKHDNLLEGNGILATMAKLPSVYLKFASDWVKVMLSDLSELIQ